ncbi:MAG: hypothetical protein IPN17_20165 [Deltaproteobacteria bacterium]|nr:hypothetical protein [Deltaproteobacteria bacterium]
MVGALWRVATIRSRAGRSPESGILLPRRSLLRGGLAGFAAAMMTRALPGCSDPLLL